jgi:type IV secretion system protein VirB11
VLISGGTGGGKTTLVNAILDRVAEETPDDRLVVLEDTVELQCKAQNYIALRATDTVDMRRLLRATMRFRPDRIIVGEVRGGEALSMVKAWNTGHDGGLCTLHANTAQSALTRLEQLIAEVSAGNMRPVIAEAVNLIIPIVKTRTSRVVNPIVRVEGLHNGEYVLSHLEG